MTGKVKFYIGEDEVKYPLYEARFSTAFVCYRSDAKKAIIGHPKHCVEAKSLCRDRKVIEAYIGSGRIAIVVYKGNPDDEDTRYQVDHAIRYEIRAKSAKVRDAFDMNQELKTQTLMLHPIKNKVKSKPSKSTGPVATASPNVKTTPKPPKKQITAGHVTVPKRPRAELVSA